jgi:hypothetical protein
LDKVMNLNIRSVLVGVVALRRLQRERREQKRRIVGVGEAHGGLRRWHEPRAGNAKPISEGERLERASDGGHNDLPGVALTGPSIHCLDRALPRLPWFLAGRLASLARARNIHRPSNPVAPRLIFLAWHTLLIAEAKIEKTRKMTELMLPAPHRSNACQRSRQRGGCRPQRLLQSCDQRLDDVGAQSLLANMAVFF